MDDLDDGSVAARAGSVTVGNWKPTRTRCTPGIALEVLLARFPALALDPDRPPVFRGWEFRAPRNLDVLLGSPRA